MCGVCACVVCVARVLCVCGVCGVCGVCVCYVRCVCMCVCVCVCVRVWGSSLLLFLKTGLKSIEILCGFAGFMLKCLKNVVFWDPDVAILVRGGTDFQKFEDVPSETAENISTDTTRTTRTTRTHESPLSSTPSERCV